MMRKAWLTPHSADLSTLTLESLRVEPEHQRISAHENTFPAADPKHHVIVIGLLQDNDLMEIMFAIKDYLEKR